jgi:Fic family protein
MERGEEEPLQTSKMSLEERIEKARQFIKKNGFMRVNDYAQLTGLSYSTASRELRRLASDPTSGITSQGRRSSKLYVLLP